MSQFLSERFSQIDPYVPGEQPRNMQYIKLNTNESPYPPSPKVVQSIDDLQLNQLQLYSDPEVTQLISEIASFYQVKPSQVFAGNGSDEVLAFSFMAFCDDQKQICYPDITYGFYKVFSQLFGIESEQIPLKSDLSIDIKDYCNRNKNIIIANPNAPTGLCLPLDGIRQILQTNPNHLVIIDEAYIDFGGVSAVGLLDEYPNLMVVQTFSKSRSLAGARLGFAIASEKLIEDLNKIKFSYNPYNVNRLSIVAGAQAMADKPYFEQCTHSIMNTRAHTKAQLEQLGFSVLDSKTNFLFACHKKICGEEYYLKLKNKGILVRHFKQERIENYVRITIGTPEQMEILLAVTKELLKEQVS